MEIKIENIGVMLPSEMKSNNRTLSFRDDGEFLQIGFIGDSDNQEGTITLTKHQTKLLSDILKVYFENDLLDD